MKKMKMIKGEIFKNHKIVKQSKKPVLKNRKQETTRQWTMKNKKEKAQEK